MRTSVPAHRAASPRGPRLTGEGAGAAAGRGRNPSGGGPGVTTTSCTHHFEMPPRVAVRCRPTLDLELEAVTRHLTHCGRHESRCLADDHRRWHHLPCPTVTSSGTAAPDGGDRWVAHTGVAGHRRVGHLRQSAGIGGPGHRRAVVVTPPRGGPGRGAGNSADRSASSRSHRASSCCRRIHSASTIADASSSRLVAHAVLVAMSPTPFPECCAPGPASEVDRVRR